MKTKFLVDTPKGRGKLLKIFVRHKTKMVRVSFTKMQSHYNKRGKKITQEIYSVKNFPYELCSIIKRTSKFEFLLKRIRKFFDFSVLISSKK